MYLYILPFTASALGPPSKLCWNRDLSEYEDGSSQSTTDRPLDPDGTTHDLGTRYGICPKSVHPMKFNAPWMSWLSYWLHV